VEESVTAASARVTDAYGGADLVVNAAGVMLPNPIADGRADEWARMIDTNLTGALRVTGAFLPHLRAAAAVGGQADLVNISLIGAHVTFPRYAAYSATKAALTHLSASLRTELCLPTRAPSRPVPYARASAPSAWGTRRPLEGRQRQARPPDVRACRIVRF
jgi:NAD(P)-dependent dehydrogenase (short-subunit alcohol dehydrogenase family)